MQETPEPRGPSGRRVTQRVSLGDVEDLLTRPARAAIAYTGSDGPECLPVVVSTDGGMRIGVHPDHYPADGLPDRLVLLVDDGGYWFELRAAVWRGAVEPDADRTGEADLVWLRFEPRRFAAWDYGQLHEETAE